MGLVNDTSILARHFVSSPRERERRIEETVEVKVKTHPKCIPFYCDEGGGGWGLKSIYVAIPIFWGGIRQIFQNVVCGKFYEKC